MFDIGFSEILMVVVVSLIVIGPKRLPETVRFLGYWLGRIRRGINKARADMEREFGLDDIRRDLYNQELLGRLEQERLEVEQKLRNPQPEPPPSNPNQGELPFESAADIEWVTPAPIDSSSEGTLADPSLTNPKANPSLTATQNRAGAATPTQAHPTSAKQH